MESKSFIMDQINDVIQNAEKNDREMNEEAIEFKKKLKNIDIKIKKVINKKKQNKLMNEKKKIIKDHLHLLYIDKKREKIIQKRLSILYAQYNYISNGK